MLLVRGGSVQGLLLWLDRLGCGVYNYAYYTLGAALNTFFPLYIAALLLSVVTIILALSWIDVAEVASSFRPKTPARIVGVLEADPEGVGEGYQEIRPPVLHQRPGRLSNMRVRTVLEACWGVGSLFIGYKHV